MSQMSNACAPNVNVSRIGSAHATICRGPASREGSLLSIFLAYTLRGSPYFPSPSLALDKPSIEPLRLNEPRPRPLHTILRYSLYPSVDGDFLSVALLAIYVLRPWRRTTMLRDRRCAV
jgi:hypothetical protein